jgi:hypothetical protein
MKDFYYEIYNALMNDDVISKHIDNNNVSFFIYPNANNVIDHTIVIDEVFSPQTTDFADDKPMTYEYLLQIDVFIKQKNNVNGSLLSRELILRVSKIMWDRFGFGEFNSFKTEYYSDFNLYHAAKQFRGKNYITEGYL